jgi:hypothetical protein
MLACGREIIGWWMGIEFPFLKEESGGKDTDISEA